MKKYLTLLLVILLIFSACLVGCNTNGVPIVGSMLPSDEEYSSTHIDQEIDVRSQYIDADSCVKNDFGRVYFSYVKEDRTSVETNNLLVINEQINAVYPGSIIYVDPSFVTPLPDIFEPNYPNMTLSLRTADGRMASTNAKYVGEELFDNDASELFRKVTRSGNIVPSTSYKFAPIYSPNQASVEFGMLDDGRAGFNYPTVENSSQYYGLEVTKRYYSASIDPLKSSDVFADNVPDEVKNNSVAITDLEFGKKILIVMKTIDSNRDYESLISSYIGENGFSSSEDARRVFEDLSYEIYELDSRNKYILMPGRSYDDVKNYLANFDSYEDITDLHLIGYSARSMTDLKSVKLTRSADFYKLYKLVNDEIRVDIDRANLYKIKEEQLYGKRIISLNKDGSLNFGDWEKLYEAFSEDNIKRSSFSIDGDFACFGYSFDIVWGTDFPFSGVFYTASDIDGLVKRVDISTSGTDRHPSIECRINEEVCLYETDCSSHERYKFE